MEQGHNTKVILVDDDTFLLDMYSIKFKKYGFDVHVFPRGEDAIAKLQEGFVPDIVILDIVMPKMDGIAVLTKIREEKLAAEACTIILSNQGQPSDIEKAEKLGIDGYIIKALTIPSEVVDEVVKIYKKKKGL
jgi:DNA-binding response OmpR family regulator